MASSTDAHSSDAQPELAPGRRLGKYRIERALGAGGMGTVFLAVDTELRRTVALKVLTTDRAANPQLVRRFKSEGQAAARLEHENIVKVFEAGEIDGQLYLALEYIDGIDVQQLVSKRGRLPVRRSLEIVTQVAAALQHAYERGIVHRDIKPSNLLIRKDGLVKLADMGLARAIDETIEAGITHAGMTVGTVDYISPEQGSDSKQADIRSDLYSLGCSWYHMLTGEVPYPEGTAVDRLRAHASARIPDPRQINDRIPAAVVAVLQRLMAKRPEARYQTPQELLADLRQPTLLQHETGAADIAGLALAEDRSSSRETRPAPSTLDELLEEEARAAAQARAAANQPRRARKHERAAADRTQRTADRQPPARDPAARRELPPREQRPQRFAVDHTRFDPDTFKRIGFALIVLVVLSAIGWGVWRAAHDSGPELAPAGVNPLAQRQPAAPLAAPHPVVQTLPNQQEDPPPPPTVTTFRPDDPFPGTSAAAGSPATDVPQWVYNTRARAAPQTVASLADPAADSLEDALRNLPAAGGVIELHGPGPYRLDDPLLIEARDVLIRAADGERPVLAFGDDRPLAAVSVRSGRLELHGVHLVASGRNRRADHPLISAEAATILIRNSSITLADPAEEPVVAVQLARGPAGPARCVFENVIGRGNRLTVAAALGPGGEIVAGNCVFTVGDAPAFAIRQPAAGSLDASDAAASVRLFATLVASRNAVFTCEQHAAAAPPVVALQLRNSVLTGAGPAAAAVRFPVWPELQSGELDRPRALGVSFVTELTSWIGWPHLTAFQNSAGGDPVVVDTAAQWLQFWRSPLSSSAIQPDPMDLPQDHSAFDVAAIAASIPNGIIDVSRLPELPHGLIARLAAASARPRVPDPIDAAFAGPVVTRELARFGLKLNDLLNGPDCPDGARVVLTGRKRAVIEPVVLKGKSLQIEFDGGGEPLVIEPAQRGGDRPAALFRVEAGRLDLVNARLRIPSSESSSHPLRLLQVIGGSFALRRCVLHGQFGAGAREVPTVEWLPSDQDPAQFGLIQDSLVAGRSLVVGAELHGQLLELRNSIAVSGADALRLVAANPDRVATLHLSRTTLSAAGACVRIEPPAEPTPSGRLQVFVGESVYFPPVVDSTAPILLLQQSYGDRTPQIDWWEQDNAVSDRITRFRVADPARTDPQGFAAAWLRGWGLHHVENVLSGPLSVIPTARQVDLPKAQPADFRLSDKSAAATARSDGGPLGADVDSVGPRELRADSGTKPTPAPTTPRPRNKVDF